jgi:septal ring factor EnvC (AmiA/AmiB activator)
MDRRRSAGAPTVLAAVALALASALGAPALRGQSPPAEGDTAAGAAEREAELEAIRGEIAELQAAVERSKLKAAGLEGELERLALELELSARRVAEATAAHALAAARVAESEASIAALEERLAVERRRLEARLAGLYRLGRHGPLRLFLALQPGDDLLPGVRLLRYLARRDATLVGRFEDLKARLAVEREELVARRGEAAGWLAQESRRRDQLARLEREKERRLAGTRREGARLADRALELAERARKLSSFLDFLYGRDAGALAGVPFADFRGVLDWPVAGRIVVEFGPRLDPRYGTRVPHNGVDVATRPGADVRVVYPGKVVFAAPFEGYGPTVVVQHAGRAFTLYAGLERVEVARDDLLSLHQPLGRAGPSLYFEIRIENRPENPRTWMRSSTPR